MLPLTFIRRPLTPAQADAIMRRAWIAPVCFYAIGVAAALVLVALITLGFSALGLRYGLAIVCLLLVAFIPAAVAYARAPCRPPSVTATTTREKDRTVTELMITGDTTFSRRRLAGFTWAVSGVLISLIPLSFSWSPKSGFLMSLWAFLLIVSLLVKQTYLYFPQPRDVKAQKLLLVPSGFAFAEKDILPRLKTAAWSDVTGVGETVKGMTAIHWTADGEEGIMWLHLKDPGLSYVAFERLIDYFVSNPGRRRVLGTKDGVDVVRALLRGQDPDA
ncbi:hypothetical protein [Actinomyces bouchesdurhonensis]|uniref:hypothetical protein n=1 Tax=Actinomyces bouchesdurhonensis TaxID=1852361 RepID=UPI003AF1648E